MHPEARRASANSAASCASRCCAVGLPARLRLHAPTPATCASATPTTPAPRWARRRCARRRCSTSTVPATCRRAPRPPPPALVVPEMQIAHETTVAGYVNFMRDNIAQGVGRTGTAAPNRRDLQADFSGRTRAGRPAGRAGRALSIAKLMCGSMPAALKAEIQGAIDEDRHPGAERHRQSNQAAGRRRQAQPRQRGDLPGLISPEFQVQK